MSGILGSRHILIVEDDYFIASDLKKILLAEGANVVGPVGDLFGATRLAESEKIDIAVLDVNLRGSNSYTLADSLAKRAIPHMFLTGYDGWSMPEKYRHTPRLSKPFCVTQVVKMIEELLETRS
ncbi:MULTISPECIES: response regulator [Sphingobium]|uniref:response regulator n=1 Tax=Sphingobium TaxID=165695 RepID=UPI001BE6426F|nr:MULTISPECIES: response regulator [Sphingobium]MBT2245033.1 response regulator [Sphingobium sp. BHU LFT2]WBQ19392.1 response regulator [Sphingobium yanoikuyae]